jgi:hypothetical protein
MIEQCQPGVQDSVFMPLVSVHLTSDQSTTNKQRSIIEQNHAPGTKHSIRACLFMLLYIAAYIRVGYAGFAFIENAWLTISR